MVPTILHASSCHAVIEDYSIFFNGTFGLPRTSKNFYPLPSLSHLQVAFSGSLSGYLNIHPHCLPSTKRKVASFRPRPWPLCLSLSLFLFLLLSLVSTHFPTPPHITSRHLPSPHVIFHTPSISFHPGCLGPPQARLPRRRRRAAKRHRPSPPRPGRSEGRAAPPGVGHKV